MTRIFVQDLEFFAYLGFFEEERRVGNRFNLNLEVEATEEAGKSDLLEDTLDYAGLAQTAVDAATASKYATVERAVDEIGSRILANFPRAQSVRVRLAKLSPPMVFQVAAAGVDRTFIRTNPG